MRFMVNLCILLGIAFAATANAEDKYPSKTITMVIPGPAGGAIDNVARVIAAEMQEELGVPVIIDPLQGAGGRMATSKVAHATPDGYTILFHHLGVAIAPALYKTLDYDTVKDLVPLGLTTEVPTMIVARNDLAPQNPKDLIAFLKQQGDKISIGSTGPGNVAGLCLGLLEQQYGLKPTEIVYGGAPAALIDMIGGRIDMMCDQTSTSASQVRSKAIKTYGVASKNRIDLLPEVPTLSEGGMNFKFSVWQGLYAPGKTPRAIVDKLSSVIQKVVTVRAVKERLANYGVTMVAPDRATSAAHREFLESEMKRWAVVYANTERQ